MITYQVYCPQCQSKDVETTLDKGELEARSISIDDYAVFCCRALDLVLRVKPYTTKCKTCGYSKSFSV